MAKTKEPEEVKHYKPTLVLGLADGSVIKVILLDQTPEAVMVAARHIASELAIKRTM